MPETNQPTPLDPNRDHSSEPALASAYKPARRKAGWGWLVAVVVVAMVWAGAFALRGGGEAVDLKGWADGLEQGQAQAKAQDKPMVVMFTATWCGPCQTLKQQVLTRPEVDDVLKARFVPVKVDMSDAGPGDALVTRYDLKGWPTMIAMTPQGEEIRRIEGVVQTDTFLDWLESIER
ncbi:MAG: thioredoxin family protein [Phycisphaeraceae bacterium]